MPMNSAVARAASSEAPISPYLDDLLVFEEPMVPARRRRLDNQIGTRLFTPGAAVGPRTIADDGDVVATAQQPFENAAIEQDVAVQHDDGTR
jgi:hypothetical protein